jgi:hypothetical protein
VSSKLLLEAGFSYNRERYDNVYQDGLSQPRLSAAWYAGARKNDNSTNFLWNASSAQLGNYPDKYNIMTAVSYVTGSHNVKVGIQDAWGPYLRWNTATLTDRPVRWIVNSHWHWDHWYGTETYQQAFPDVRIVAHEKTRELMMGPALEFSRPGLETQLPNYLENLEQRAPANPALRPVLAEDRFFLEQKSHVPNRSRSRSVAIRPSGSARSRKSTRSTPPRL